MNSYEGETKRYNDYEVNILIEDLTEAALEAIEQTAAEAAKAAALAAIEREAEALQAQAALRREVELWKGEAAAAKKNGAKNTFIAALCGILGGLAIGVGGALAISK